MTSDRLLTVEHAPVLLRKTCRRHATEGLFAASLATAGDVAIARGSPQFTSAAKEQCGRENGDKCRIR